MTQMNNYNHAGGRPIACGGDFAMLHLGYRQTAVLICAPWGYEALCAHKSLRILADQLAERGFHTLRFDYPGCGNSVLATDDARGITPWVDAVRVAARQLLVTTGASRIVLVGLGLGTLMAQMAAPAIPELAGLVLLGPAPNGRRYLRELSAWSKVIDQSIGLVSTGETADKLSIAGFQMPRGIAAGVKSITQQSMPACDVPYLIATRSSHPSDLDLAQQISERGLSCQTVAFDGYENLMNDPTAAKAPDQVWRETCRWMSAQFGDEPLIAAPSLPAAPLLQGARYAEQPMRFGRDDRLFGILCTPAAHAAPLPPVYVFVNSGLDPHIGWARSTVEQARALAAAGISSLRMDCADIGESPAFADSPATVLYSSAQERDLTAAIDHLSRLGYTRILVAGRCAGAFVALNAAVNDDRIKGAVVINVQRLVWDPDEDVDEAIRNAFRSLGSYRTRLMQVETLRRILTGEINVLRAGRDVLRRVMAKIGVKLAPFSFGLTKYARLNRAVHHKFQALAARKVPTALVYSGDDGGLDELATYFGQNRRKLSTLGNVSLAIVPGADHNMTPRFARDAVLQQLISLAQATSPQAAATGNERREGGRRAENLPAAKVLT